MAATLFARVETLRDITQIQHPPGLLCGQCWPAIPELQGTYRAAFLRYTTQISPRVSPHDRRLRQKTVCNDLTDLKYHACGHEHPCGITERFSQASNSTPLLRTTPWLLSIGVFARPSAPPRGRHRSHRKDCPFSSSDRESLIRCAR